MRYLFEEYLNIFKNNLIIIMLIEYYKIELSKNTMTIFLLIVL